MFVAPNQGSWFLVAQISPLSFCRYRNRTGVHASNEIMQIVSYTGWSTACTCVHVWLASTSNELGNLSQPSCITGQRAKTFSSVFSFSRTTSSSTSSDPCCWDLHGWGLDEDEDEAVAIAGADVTLQGFRPRLQTIPSQFQRH